MVADACQGQRRGCLTSTFFKVRESQRLQWSHFANFLGQAANFEVQPSITTATTTQLRFVRCQCLYVGALFWGRRSRNLVIVVVLGSCGTLALSRASYIFCLPTPFAHSELFIQLASSSKTMASQKMGNQCKGLSPFIARLRLYGIQALWVRVVTSGMQRQ